MEEILKILGCSSESEAISAVARFDSMLRSVQTLTGAEGREQIEAAIRSHKAMAESLQLATEKTSPAEAIGVLNAWKAQMARAEELEAELKAEREKAEKLEAEQLMNDATRDGRLKPANRPDAQGMFNDFGLKGLQSYLNTLRPTGPRTSREVPEQPEPTQGGNVHQLTEAQARMAKLWGTSTKKAAANEQFWADNQSRGSLGHEAFVFEDEFVKELNEKNGWLGFVARPEARRAS